MNIYLIRHGRQSSALCNVNVDLAEEGYEQAELLGERLRNFSIDGLYSSHLTRAVQTAEVINKYLNQTHIIKEELREISFGELEGNPNEYNYEFYKDFFEKQLKHLEDIPYPQGENGKDVFERASVILDEILKSGKQNIAIVTHGGVIRALISGLLGIPMNKKLLLGHSLENCSLTQLTYDERKKQWYLQRFNDYSHLEMHPELLRCNWL